VVVLVLVFCGGSRGSSWWFVVVFMVMVGWFVVVDLDLDLDLVVTIYSRGGSKLWGFQF